MTKIICAGPMRDLIAILIIVAVIWGGDAPVFAQSANVVFILDASGSMDARIGTRNPPKIEMVREVLSEAVGYMSSDRRVGVVAFGHRNKGDCEDVEELVPMVPLIGNRELIIGNIAGITPVGMTPLALAMEQAAEMLRARKEPGAVVVIADGQDSCLGEPCELARGLGGADSRFAVHVIGLNVSRGAENRLSCVADAGGGEFFQVRNAHELKSALRKAMATAEDAAGTENETEVETGDTRAAAPLPEADAIGDLPDDGTPPDESSPVTDTQKTAGSLVTRADVGRIRESPSLESAVRFRVMKGDIVSASAMRGEWYLIDAEGKTGWGHESLFIPLSVKEIGTVEKISVVAGPDEDKVVFEMKRAGLPKISFLQTDTPQVACDFADTAPADGVGSEITVDGKRIRKINAGVRGKNGFRVVLDLAPGDYELAHIFNKNETRYVLIVTKRAQTNGADG